MAESAESLKNSVTVIKPQVTAATIHLPSSLHEYLRGLAAEHERSLSGELRWVLKRYSDDPQAFGE